MSLEKRFGSCGCKTGCTTNHCPCRANSKRCGPFCNCKSEVGCGNLVTCTCKGMCDTLKCSCNKSGINCDHNEGACKCDRLTCINNDHEYVIIGGFKDSKKLDKIIPEKTSNLTYNENNYQPNYTQSNAYHYHQTNVLVLQQTPSQQMPPNQYYSQQPPQLPSVPQYPQITNGPKIGQIANNIATAIPNNMSNITHDVANTVGKQFLEYYFKNLYQATKLVNLFTEDAKFIVHGKEAVGRLNIEAQLALFKNIQGEIYSHEINVVDSNIISIVVNGKND